MSKDTDFDSLFNGGQDPTDKSTDGFDDLFGEPAPVKAKPVSAAGQKPAEDSDPFFDDQPAPPVKEQSENSSFDFGTDLSDSEDFLQEKASSPEKRTESESAPRGDMPDRRRGSNDFKPDMDALLITAQSSMIIEGTHRLTEMDFSSMTMQVYAEAIKGLDLYIKIIQRNPNNYRKLTGIIRSDIDCAEVERIAFGIYKTRHHDLPENDAERLKAYEYYRDKLKNGYKKSLIANSISQIKQYFLLSGGLDTQRVSALIACNNPVFKTDIAKLNQNIQIAIELSEKGEGEIQKGLRGRDTNTYIIKTSQLLYYYYSSIGEAKTAEYYKRQYSNFKKYNIVK